MVQFPTWCANTQTSLGAHQVHVLTGNAAQLQLGIAATAATVPGHYASEERIAHMLRALGKPQSAALIEAKLPTTKAIRSGDLGEIFATEWIASHSAFSAPIKRLRWKDHRNMAMRGEDVIALQRDPISGRLSFLKTEAKSRAKLTGQVLIEARGGLDKEAGLPSAHALSFISARLFELGDAQLADAIDDATFRLGIQPHSVSHLLFTFSGNAPAGLLTTSLQNYAGPFTQYGVGLHVDGHTGFVGAVYNQVIADANKP